MRIDLTKWLMIGPESISTAFFEKAQEIGIIEFIHKKSPAFQLTSDQQVLVDALKILKNYEPVAGFVPCDSCQKVAESCLETYQAIQEITAELTELKSEFEHVSILGDFSLDALKKIEADTKLSPQFVYSESMHELPESLSSRFFEIATREGVHYYFWMAMEKETLPEGFLVMKVDRDAKTLQSEINKLQERLEVANAYLSHCKQYENDLRNHLSDLINRHTRYLAQSSAHSYLNKSVCVCEGWVPSSKQQLFEEFLSLFPVISMKLAVSEADQMPTYLENKLLGQVGADLVEIYDVPSNDDFDPSLWVVVSFALFFGMIVGDGGYGSLFLAGALYGAYKLREKKGQLVRLKLMALFLSLSCLVWGLFSNSFFGLSFPPTHQLRKISLIHQISLKKVSYHWRLQDSTYKEAVAKMPRLEGLNPGDAQKILEEGFTEVKSGKSYDLASDIGDQILREFSLFVGAVHLILSMLRFIRRNIANAGWILFIVGGWLYFPKVVGTITFVNYFFGLDPQVCAQRGLEIIYVGIGFGVAVGVFKNRLLGLLDFTQPIQIFADVMSYLRLYALGLSGAIMASTFNDLASRTGFVSGIIIIVIGHTINMGLNIMSGVIHGLRLNFLEWYRYSFSGGGRWFRPLKKINTQESSGR